MMSTGRNFTVEHALYGLALALGLGVRLLHLGRLPLSDFEAGWALQALDLARGTGREVGANPAYVHLTTLLFYLLPASNFLARLWPALAGSSLVLLPFLWRDRLGRTPALFLAFGLALDPGLAALSRLAGGPMIALTALLWTATAWRRGRPVLTGICAGLALLSGPAVWFGLLSLVLAGGLERGLALAARPPRPGNGWQAPPDSPIHLDWRQARIAAWWGLGTLLLLGTLGLLSPLGLSGLFGGLTDFLRGWQAVPQTAPRLLLAALPAYAPLALVFALTAIVRAVVEQNDQVTGLGLWALIVLLLAFAYPARQVSDLAWMLIPLWALAAGELGRHLDFESHSRWGVAGMVTLTFALLTSIWFYLLNAVSLNLPVELGQVRYLILLGLFLVLALTLLLVAYGWSLALSRLGLVWGGGLFLFLLTIASLTDAAGLRQPRTVELWTPGPRLAQPDLLLETVEELSAWNSGDPRGLPVTVAGVDSPALRWLLRDHPLAWLAAPPVNQAPPLLITAELQPNLMTAYRGQDFVWRQTSDWSILPASEWLRWYLFRQVPMQSENIILWARSDLLLEASPAAP